MNILVSGANGFVGRSLCLAYARSGHFVRAVARDFSQVDFPAHIDKLTVPDIHADTQWASALRDVDVVVHLAARVNVMHDGDHDPLAAYRKVNVDGTRRLAESAAQAGVRRFVFLSSIKVNGEQTEAGQPFHADDAPEPDDAYGISKLEAEQALRGLCAETDMEFVVIRPPLVYGPGVRGNFRALLHWLERGIPLPLGAINNQRSLVALDNLIDFIFVCLTHPAAANQVFLVADEKPVSTTELLHKVARAYGRDARLLSIPPVWLRRCATLVGKSAAAERLLGSLVVDWTKARDLLGWSPVISMDEQLRKMAKDDSRS